MSDNINKKAISPLIATVLLIAFTIILLALILNWTTKLTKSNLEKIQAEGEFKCITEVEIEVDTKIIDFEEYLVIENLGGVPIDSFIIGINKLPPQHLNINAPEYSINQKKIAEIGASTGDTVSVMPVLKIQGVNIPCSKKAVTINI